MELHGTHNLDLKQEDTTYVYDRTSYTYINVLL